MLFYTQYIHGHELPIFDVSLIGNINNTDLNVFT